MTKISITVAMKDKPTDCPCNDTPEEIVRGWVEDVESGRDSRLQWECLRRLFDKLALKKTLSDQGYRLLKMMEPAIKRYGEYDPKGSELSATYPCEQKGGSHEK